MTQVLEQVYRDYRQLLTEQELTAIAHEISIMERPDAAAIEALKIVQQRLGWIDDEHLYAIAQRLQMPVADLEGVATFYNLIYRRPVGRYVIHICDSIGCHLTGYEQVLTALRQHLQIDYGETSSDGLFTLLSNACLGGCDQAPVMMIAQQHYQQLTPDKAIEIVQRLRQQALAEVTDET